MEDNNNRKEITRLIMVWGEAPSPNILNLWLQYYLSCSSIDHNIWYISAISYHYIWYF